MPVVRADDLTDEQIRALRLADNKTNESEWDFLALEAELAELEMDFDMSEFGFNDVSNTLDVSDDQFVAGTEVTKDKKKTITCPNCGEEIEV